MIAEVPIDVMRMILRYLGEEDKKNLKISLTIAFYDNGKVFTKTSKFHFIFRDINISIERRKCAQNFSSQRRHPTDFTNFLMQILQ